MSANEPQTDADLVRRIATLARLEIDEAEARELGADFASILEQFRALAEVEVEAPDDGQPAGSAWRGADARAEVLRDDVPWPPFPSEALLERAPRRDGDFYSVPKTITTRRKGGDVS